LFVQPPGDGVEMYVEFFQQHRMPVLAVANARDALAAAPKAAVVVTGLRLQGRTDGIGLIRQLRSDQQLRHLPIIVLTACAWQTDREGCQQAGCDVFLSKPCLPEVLLREVRRLLASRRGNRRRAAAVREGQAARDSRMTT
jgi:CheY-like chemotaxis protein